jgi:hypothetical protein
MVILKNFTPRKIIVHLGYRLGWQWFSRGENSQYYPQLQYLINYVDYCGATLCTIKLSYHQIIFYWMKLVLFSLAWQLMDMMGTDLTNVSNFVSATRLRPSIARWVMYCSLKSNLNFASRTIICMLNTKTISYICWLLSSCLTCLMK